MTAIEAGGFRRDETETSGEDWPFHGRIFGVPVMVAASPSEDRGNVDEIEVIFPDGTWDGPTPDRVLSVKGFVACLRRVFGEESRHGVLEWQEYLQWESAEGWSLEFEFYEDALFGGHLRLFAAPAAAIGSPR